MISYQLSTMKYILGTNVKSLGQLFLKIRRNNKIIDCDEHAYLYVFHFHIFGRYFYLTLKKITWKIEN